MSDYKTPVDMLLRWEKEKPDTVWLVQPYNGKTLTWTWAQAAREAKAMAGALRALGLNPGDRVAISGRNTAHWFLADLACGLAGLVAIGLYPKQSADAVTFILEHSEARALFLGPMTDQEEFMGALPEGLVTIGFPYDDAPRAELRWDDLVAKSAPLTTYVQPKPEDLAALIYTSGTTGNPKGVMITWGNIAWASSRMLEVLPPRGKERLFSYLPLAHAFERGAVLATSLYLGAEVHFLESLDKLASQLPQVQPTRFYGVPLVYSRFQSGVLKNMPQKKLELLTSIPIVGGIVRRKILKKLGFANASAIFSGAAPLPTSVAEWFRKYLKLDILQGYGMTENTIYASANLPDANKIGSVGKPLPGSGCKISEQGEILFKHPAVMAGYYKEPDKTAETFTADGYLRTGDKGRIDDDGYLHITGRVKDIFKTLKGKYVSPAPIEGALARNVDIDQLCFVGNGLTQPIMLVTLAASAKGKPKEQLEKELIADMKAVNEGLEPHEEIAKIVVCQGSWSIDNGVMTPTMKVKRNEIEKRYAALIEKEGKTRTPIGWE